MATEIVVPSALPNEFNFALPASLPAAKTYEIRVQPVSLQTFTTTLTGGGVIQFDIPCGRRGQYIDTSTTYVKFKATYTHLGTVGTDYSCLLGTGYSYFNKQEVYGNNSVTLETINELGVLANMLCNAQLNASDKVGLAPAFGFGDTHIIALSNQGHFINVASPNALIFSYALPVIGILGSGTDKYLPVGAFNSLRYELTLDAMTNITALLTGTAANKITSCVVSEFEFCGQMVELDAGPQSMIEMANPDKIHIRSQSYRTATNSIPGGSNGLVDVLIGTRVSSCKSMYVTCSPENAVEKKFASVCPNLTQGSCLVLAGQNIPQRTLNPINHPGDCFMELQKALGALSSTVYNGCTNKVSYYTASTAQGLMGAYATAASGNGITAAPNTWIMGINTEIVAHRGGLLSGININSAPSFLRCQINSALSAYTHTLYIFAYHDVILEIDVNARTIVAKF